MDTVWKDIDGYDNYEVSNQGQVKNKRSGRILKPYVRGGYYSVGLCANGEKKDYAIHRLVAIAFIDNAAGLPCIDHINRDKFDNRVENLRWATYQENNRNTRANRKVLNETTGDVFGSLAEACEWLVDSGLSKNKASATQSLWACLVGKTKSCGKCQWRYVDGGDC